MDKPQLNKLLISQNGQFPGLGVTCIFQLCRSTSILRFFEIYWPPAKAEKQVNTVSLEYNVSATCFIRQSSEKNISPKTRGKLQNNNRNHENHFII